MLTLPCLLPQCHLPVHTQHYVFVYDRTRRLHCALRAFVLVFLPIIAILWLVFVCASPLLPPSPARTPCDCVYVSVQASGRCCTAFCLRWCMSHTPLR